MTRGTRLLLAVVVGGALLMLATVAVAATAVYRAGSIEVAVEEDGSNFRVKVPAGLVRAAIAVTPSSAVSELTDEIEPWLPAVEAGWRELRDTPDFVLVEVDAHDEHILVRKVGDDLLVDVDAPDAQVSVTIPLGTIDALVRKLG
jgi:hypothetical protein